MAAENFASRKQCSEIIDWYKKIKKLNTTTSLKRLEIMTKHSNTSKISKKEPMKAMSTDPKEPHDELYYERQESKDENFYPSYAFIAKNNMLEELKKEIPYKWRVQSYSKNKPSASCVAYIDARDVMDLLDEVVGPENWQDEYKMVGDKMMAGISIKFGDEWVTKWDTGSESKMEAEKGEVSDSFKRAAVKWGAGRFLYKLGIKYIPANKIKGEKDTATHAEYPYPVDNNGKRIWDVTAHINGGGASTPTDTPNKKPPVSTADKVVSDIPCPTCLGAMWDNRADKKSAKSPDYVCKQDNGQCLNGKYPTSLWATDKRAKPKSSMTKKSEEFIKSLEV